MPNKRNIITLILFYCFFYSIRISANVEIDSEIIVSSSPKDRGLSTFVGDQSIVLSGGSEISFNHFYLGVFAEEVNYFKGDVVGEPEFQSTFYFGKELFFEHEAVHYLELSYSIHPSANRNLAGKNFEVSYYFEGASHWELKFDMTNDKWGSGKFGYSFEVSKNWSEWLKCGYFTILTGYHGLSNLEKEEAISYFYGAASYTVSKDIYSVSLAYNFLESNARDFYQESDKTSLNLEIKYRF